MKIRVEDATEQQLNQLVAQCEGADYTLPHSDSYCTKPEQAWPIIDRERIRIHPYSDKGWYSDMLNCTAEGPTSLIAAMRCYVISKLGQEVTIPNGLTDV